MQPEAVAGFSIVIMAYIQSITRKTTFVKIQWLDFKIASKNVFLANTLLNSDKPCSFIQRNSLNGAGFVVCNSIYMSRQKFLCNIKFHETIARKL